jgi:hypothetical protein
MSTPLLRSAGALGALALTLATAPSAFAAGSVFGGATGGDEPIVLTGDRAAKKLKSAVIATESKCDDGMYFPFSAKVTPVKPDPGFDAGARDLVVDRNAKGRFSGAVTTAYDLGDSVALVETTLSGKLKAKRASGSISTDVGIVDAGSSTPSVSCHSGRVSWSATRSPGRVYGGTSSQEEPVVVRLDAKRKKVSDVLASWETAVCTPDNFLRFPDRFTNFPLHAGSFGDSFDQTYDGPDGAKRAFAYTVNGRVGRRSATGTLHVGVTQTDAAGATTLSCDTGNVTWKAATG